MPGQLRGTFLRSLTRPPGDQWVTVGNIISFAALDVPRWGRSCWASLCGRLITGAAGRIKPRSRYADPLVFSARTDNEFIW